MPFVERSSSTDPRRLCYHKTPTHDPNQYWGSVTFWYGSGSSDPYLWLTDPDADPKGSKTHGSGSPSLIRTYIARLAGPDPHSFRFIKILIRFYWSFDLKDLDPLLFLLNGSILRMLSPDLNKTNADPQPWQQVDRDPDPHHRTSETDSYYSKIRIYDPWIKN